MVDFEITFRNSGKKLQIVPHMAKDPKRSTFRFCLPNGCPYKRYDCSFRYLGSMLRKNLNSNVYVICEDEYQRIREYLEGLFPTTKQVMIKAEINEVKIPTYSSVHRTRAGKR